MSNGTKVVKRNGKTEPLDLNKLHVMVEEACKDLAGVSASCTTPETIFGWL